MSVDYRKKYPLNADRVELWFVNTHDGDSFRIAGNVKGSFAVELAVAYIRFQKNPFFGVEIVTLGTDNNVREVLYTVDAINGRTGVRRGS